MPQIVLKCLIFCFQPLQNNFSMSKQPVSLSKNEHFTSKMPIYISEIIFTNAVNLFTLFINILTYPVTIPEFIATPFLNYSRAIALSTNHKVVLKVATSVRRNLSASFTHLSLNIRTRRMLPCRHFPWFIYVPTKRWRLGLRENKRRCLMQALFIAIMK